MHKISRTILMTAGLIMMCVISVIFGFAETEIPNVGYLGMWILCAGAVYYGSGAEACL